MLTFSVIEGEGRVFSERHEWRLSPEGFAKGVEMCRLHRAVILPNFEEPKSPQLSKMIWFQNPRCLRVYSWVAPYIYLRLNVKRILPPHKPLLSAHRQILSMSSGKPQEAWRRPLGMVLDLAPPILPKVSPTLPWDAGHNGDGRRQKSNQGKTEWSWARLRWEVPKWDSGPSWLLFLL